MYLKKILLVAASLALAASTCSPLSAATSASLPTVSSLIASSKDRSGKVNPTNLADAINAATSDPVQRAELAQALAEAAVQLVSTDPRNASLMVYAATQVVKNSTTSSKAPAAALAIGNAAIAIAKNPAVLADSSAASIIDNAVVNAARIASNLRSVDAAGAASLAQGARSVAPAVDTARNMGNNTVQRAVDALTRTFNTDQSAGDGSPSGRGP